MWELFLLLLGQYVHPAGGPHAHEVIYKLTACLFLLIVYMILLRFAAFRPQN